MTGGVSVAMRSYAALLLFLPAILAAQLPGMGSMGRGRGPGKLARDPGIEVAKPLNPVNLLVEHRQELALSDSQFARVLVIKRMLDSTNSPFMRRVDSVQRIFKGGPMFSDPSRARRDSLSEGREVVRESLAAVEENIAEAKEKAFALLSSSQLVKAEQVEEKARKAGESPGRGR